MNPLRLPHLTFLLRPLAAGLCFLALTLIATFAGVRAAAQTAQTTHTLQLGTRTFITTQTTPDGTPVIHLWKAPMPTSNQSKACGFPILKDAQHHFVWRPGDLRDGAYNHYACLIFHNGRFHAMWANHPHGEDGPGQRVLYSSSRDGLKWTPPAEFFPPPGPVQKTTQKGIHLKPDRWVEVDGKLHAVVYARGAGAYPIVRELAGDGTFGEPLLLRALPKGATLPKFMPEPSRKPALAAKINKWYEDNDTVSWWAYGEKKVPAKGVDGAHLIEPFAFRSKDGVVVFHRDYSGQTKTKAETRGRKSSNRVYASFADGKGGWSAPHPTDIPDSHSRGQALRLPDGRVLLVGSQIAPQFDKGLYLTRDPLTLAISPDGEFFTKVFALRSGGNSPEKHRFSGITGRGAGYAYPSMLLHDGMIYVLYSINKEDMAITSVPLSSLRESEI